MSKEAMDASSQTMGRYCMPCAEMAKEKILVMYIKSLSKKRYAYYGNMIINQYTEEVIVIAAGDVVTSRYGRGNR